MDLGIQAPDEVKTDVVVIGAGISGVATAKCLQEAGFKVVVLERTGDVGGLWTFKEKAYGVMRFTHINVSKQNYCFSDFPFPDDVPDFPHNVEMAQYVRDYMKHFQVDKLIRFNREVHSVEQEDGTWRITAVKVDEDKDGIISPTDQKEVYTAKFVAIATGHHQKPSWPNFPGQDSFTGTIAHSVSYNDAHSNGLAGGKRVVVVGIGNSAIDVAVNAAEEGICRPVYLSTRSGAWVVPNYVFGHPVDHYACRLFLWLPWQLATTIFETVLKVIQGNPKKWKLNPKMRALQTQPSVSPVLIHHIQRGHVKVKPNIQKIDGKKVHFTDGSSVEADHLILCTGYKIDLPFLSEDVHKKVLDDDSNQIKLFKNVFNPDIGSSLAFIGFVQPASGGVLSMSEIQARWFAELCKGNIALPSPSDMKKDIHKELEENQKRYFASARHTIQRDPILYNDEVASYFGAKPALKKYPWISWRLLLGTCGPAQYRLQGPHPWSKAYQEVCRVPVTEFILYGTVLAILLLLGILMYFFCWMFDKLEDVFGWD